VRHEPSAHQLQSLLLELRVGESIRVGLADTPIAVITLLKKTGTKARLQIQAQLRFTSTRSGKSSKEGVALYYWLKTQLCAQKSFLPIITA
jgi:hypothetical protein